MSASLTGTGNYAPLSNLAGAGNAAGGGTPGLIYENDPSFSFVPVNDQANAQLLLQPVPENVFYSLFQQGWRIDQLFRLMVDRIEVTLPPDPGKTADKGCRIEVIRNVPPPAIYGPDFTQSSRDLNRYVTFLRVSAVVYALQKHGLLLLRGTNSFEPIDPASYIPNETSAPRPASGDTAAITAAITQARAANVPVSVTVAGSQPGGDAAPKSASAPAAKDFNDAAAKSQEWQLQQIDSPAYKGNAWVLGQKTLDPKFQLNTMVPDPNASPDEVYGQSVKTVENMLRSDLLPSDPSLAQLSQAPELTDTLAILFSGFAIGGSATDQDTGTGPCTSRGPSEHGIVTSHLVLRSLIGLMAAAAQEQAFYDEIAKSGIDPVVPMEKDDLVPRIHTGLMIAARTKKDDPDYLARVNAVKDKVFHFSDLVPSIERLPVLRLSWPPDVKLPVAHSDTDARAYGLSLNYRGKDYCCRRRYRQGDYR